MPYRDAVTRLPQRSGEITSATDTNLRTFCQRCHMLHDRPHHLAQRWITYRRRHALADLFSGPYERPLPFPVSQAVPKP